MDRTQEYVHNKLNKSDRDLYMKFLDWTMKPMFWDQSHRSVLKKVDEMLSNISTEWLSELRERVDELEEQIRELESEKENIEEEIEQIESLLE